jgi:hypothetical protein
VCEFWKTQLSPTTDTPCFCFLRLVLFLSVLLCTSMRITSLQVRPPQSSSFYHLIPGSAQQHCFYLILALSPQSQFSPIFLNPSLTASSAFIVTGEFPSLIYLGRCYQLISFISPLFLVLNTGPLCQSYLLLNSPNASQGTYYVSGSVQGEP